jgi:hypothetical protein
MEIDFEVLRQKLKQGAAITEPLKRRLWVLGVITEALKADGIRPILIGGCALEYYTFGGYATRDIDVAVSDYQRLGEVMDELGFERRGRYWLRSDLEILLEAPAADLAGETAPLTVVELDDLTCYIIGVEDLIIDRLNGYVHWGWEDDRRWVGRLLVLHADAVDWAYLERRAITEGTVEALAEIGREVRAGENC